MELFQHITSRQTTLLTPNRRLAAYHLKQHHQYQSVKGETVWNSLDILPFNSWLERVWNEYSHHHISEPLQLLNSNQELMLWEKIISQSPESEHLLQATAAAELAKSAWGILKQWSVSLNHDELSITEDSHAFLKWATEFQEQCIKENWLDQNSLATLITEKILLGLIQVPEKIILIGFSEISPQFQKLLNAYEKRGVEIVYHVQAEKNNCVRRISLVDKEDEIRTMARWAKELLRDSNLISRKAIGCVVPNLEDHRDIVSRVFTEVFTEKGYYTNNALVMPFNISAGKNLASYPIIYTALQLLELNTDLISIETLSHILHSPFLGDSEKEMLRRADFANQLRKENINSISLTKLLNRKHKPDLLTKRFADYFEKLSSLKSKKNISEWVQQFIELLTLLGWPGERSVNSEEYQLIQRWMNLLNEYASFEVIADAIHYKSALQYLRRLTSQTVFQIQSPKTPIQILGILEAAEIPFDYLWVMGMDDTSWPPTPKPNPFIPQQLQKSLSMPHATAERELNFCNVITKQLKNSASTIIFSHPLHDAESEVRGSSLLNDIQEIKLEDLQLTDNIRPAHYSFEHKQVEKLQDDSAAPLNTANPISGGAKIFELQAACPFKAFAELRLFARPIETTTPGLRALDRGNIVHEALELIWAELKDSTTLHMKSTEDLQALVEFSIKNAILKITGEATTSLNYLTLELKRLQKIIWNWLEIEKKRPRFTVIEQEQTHSVTIANIPITLRIDRIDELDNGDRFIIDYKTGKHSQVQDWFGERPDAPQLPLYCILDPTNTVGIAFAIINSEKMELKGISKHNLNIENIDTLIDVTHGDTQSWEEQLTVWRQTLEKLGEDFCQGVAHVDPKDGIQTCEHCKLKSFCRVYEKSF